MKAKSINKSIALLYKPIVTWAKSDDCITILIVLWTFQEESACFKLIKLNVFYE